MYICKYGGVGRQTDEHGVVRIEHLLQMVVISQTKTSFHQNKT